MITLNRINLVQFYLFENEQLDIAGATAILGANGSGKSTLLDATQTVMTGAHGNYERFNAQSSTTRSKRSLKSYCLGVLRGKSDGGDEAEVMAREDAMTYLALGFVDQKTGAPFTAGLCVSASKDEPKHTIHGRFILPGVLLSKDDFVEETFEGQRPLAWPDFATRAAQKVKAAGLTPIFKDKVEAYVDELLHRLAPQGTVIDARIYLRAFSESLELRDIESVDEYVRKHIVELGRIDVANFGEQIRQFESFSQLIEDTKVNIETLEKLAAHYDRAHNAEIRQASLNGLAVTYDYEDLVARIDELEEQAEKAGNDRAGADTLRQDLTSQLESVRVRRDNVVALIAADPELANHEALSQQLKDAVARIHDAESSIANNLRGLIEGLVKLEQGGVLADDQLKLLRRAKDTLHDARENLDNVEHETLFAAVVDAGALLRHSHKAFVEQRKAASDRRYEAKEALNAAATKLTNLKQGKLNLGKFATRAAEAFAEAGISAHSMCEQIEITDPDWQPAIEAYLGGQLFDFVVESGREDEAVRLIRHHPGPIYNVKVAQPKHLEHMRHHMPADDEVAKMVRSSNWLAQAFVRQALGNTKIVETEAELAIHRRAMTKDGMVSSGGGTSRRELPSTNELTVGQSSNQAMIDHAMRIYEEQRKKYNDAEEEESQLATLVGRIENYSDEQATAGLKQALQTRSAQTAQANDIRSKLGVTEGTGDKALITQREQLGTEIRSLEERISAALKEFYKAEGRHDGAEKALAVERPRLEPIRAQMQSALSQPGCDAHLVDRYRQQIDEEPAVRQSRGARARELAARATRELDGAVNTAFRELTDYEVKVRLNLADQRNDWKAGARWVEQELQTLKSSRLVEHQQAAQQALDAAHQSFKNDIAFKLNDHMQKMQTRLKSLNDLLSSCPPFSQNERYRFIYRTKKAHSKLREFIERIGRATDDSQLSFDQPQSDPEIKEALDELTALAKDQDLLAGRTPSVLTDYREFYSFDLQIRVDGEVVDTLSNRTGSGSGGEHRTPFYVIAGASLASAYRLDAKQGKEGTGGGIMLLDEAFYSMDNQNALAAARFLERLGLQLIMAAPADDMAKIGSFSNTIYDIGREGMVPWVHRAQLKKEANLLLTSDFPSENEDLVAQAMAEQR